MVENVVGCKWSLQVLALVESGVRRPGAIERSVDGLSAKVLNERLAKLTRFGILRRTTYPEVPPHVEYELTEFVRRFSGIIAEVRRLQASIDAAPGTGSSCWRTAIAVMIAPLSSSETSIVCTRPVH